MDFRRLRSARGFTMTDILVAIGLGVTLTGIAVPVATSAMASMRLSNAGREVEREIQTARLRAVANNRPMQVRFNCPGPRQYRIVEVTGVAAVDGRADRCEESVFPYPGPADSDPATPAHDGPVRYLPNDIALSGADLLFTPKGTAMKLVAGTREAIAGTETISVTRDAAVATVTINALGKIRLQIH
jgi:Tfp pilus assembly protein FimT